jgi:hypothetical protein
MTPLANQEISIQVQGQRMEATIALVRALGGIWKNQHSAEAAAAEFCWSLAPASRPSLDHVVAITFTLN